MIKTWGIPAVGELLDNLARIADAEESATRALRAMRAGAWVDGEGGREEFHGVTHPLRQLALTAWLAQQCTTDLSVEAGFGMGVTASIILSARRQAGHDFEHVVFDPYGLANGRGARTEEKLAGNFGSCFRRERLSSPQGMASLVSDRGPWCCGFFMIDGNHRFDGVMADFQMATMLLNEGGYMVLDDAAYPAVQTLVHFVEANRPDLEVSWLEITNTAVFRRVDRDQREWSHFRPFEMPDREDWQRLPSDSDHDDEDWARLGL